jgi:hypothetical protein
LEDLIKGKKVYLDTDQKTGEDQFGRLIAVVYLKIDNCNFKNVNYKMLQNEFVDLDDYTNNEFDPSTWKAKEGPFDGSSADCDGGDSDNGGGGSDGGGSNGGGGGGSNGGGGATSPNKFELRITLEGKGEIDLPLGKTVYEENSKITITATPDKDWRIKTWILDDLHLGSQKSIKFTITTDRDLQIIFEEIPPSCTLSFNVVDERTHSIEYVKITSSYQPEKQEKIIIITDSEGFAKTDLIYPGNYSFSVFKSDYEIEYRNITLNYGENQTLNVELSLILFNLNVEIIDSNDNAVPNIRVQSLVQPEGQEIVSGKTDENGVLIIHGLKTGYYSFIVLGDYVQNTDFDVASLHDRVFDISVPVQSFCSLHICIEDQDGDPLSGVLIASTSQPEGQDQLSSTCNEEMLFEEILPGDYSFKLSKEGYESSSFNISLFDGGYFARAR